MTPDVRLYPVAAASAPPPADEADAESWARTAARATGDEFRDRLPAERVRSACATPACGRGDGWVPIDDGEGELAVAVVDPFDVGLLDGLALVAGRAVRPVVASAAAVRQARLGRGGSTSPERDGASASVRSDGDEASAVRYVDALLAEAARRGASDVHLEPGPRGLRARLRLDGALVDTPGPADGLRAAVVSRVKLLAGLSLDERRLPQDGRARVRLADREIDLRVASVPALHGEALALRLLEPEAPRRGLGELGLEPADEAALRRLIGAGDGLVLVTGPTGAGKTTTLYACLHELNTPGRKLLTVEDPVEYRLPGVSQVAVRPETGMTFAAALRAFLRQAPNVVMVGEVRDAETAELALHAALTGHLVLSTLHTGDALGSVARLLDLGARPALVAAALRATVAQRLVRCVCPSCARPAAPTARERALLGLDASGAEEPRLRRGTGCPACAGTGYRGRLGVFEVLPVDDRLRSLVARGAGAGELRAAATAAGWRPLAGSAARKVLAGATTIDEFLAVTAGR